MEIAGRYIIKVEKILIQMKVLEDLQVDCVTQLLLDRAQSWWETIQSRWTAKLRT
jgi:hypothetical protein